ncbi:hypothetical protein [Lyngbya aestuarii]|uniref:hypothetical protein n=1 Tax=Lyngbya aestuarii TaxID=118322 RepID=UPI00403DB945
MVLPQPGKTLEIPVSIMSNEQQPQKTLSTKLRQHAQSLETSDPELALAINMAADNLEYEERFRRNLSGMSNEQFSLLRDYINLLQEKHENLNRKINLNTNILQRTDKILRIKIQRLEQEVERLKS